jgi:hypothetical protein
MMRVGLPLRGLAASRDGDAGAVPRLARLRLDGRGEVHRECDGAHHAVGNAILRIGQTYEVRGMVQNVTSYDNATVVSDEEKRITDVEPSLLDRLNNLDVSAKGTMKEIAFLDPGTAGITVSPTEIKTRNVNFGCDPKKPCMIDPNEISDIVLLSHELVHIIQYGRNPNFQPDYAKDWAKNIKNGMKSNRAYECTDAELEAYAFGSTLGSFLRDPAKLALLQNQPCDKPASPSLQNSANDFKKAYDAELKQARAACGK